MANLMPKSAHTRVTFSGIFGTVGAPVENWQFNLNFQTSQFAGGDGDTTAAAAAATAWGTHLAPITKPSQRLVKVRVAHVANGGLVVKTTDGGYAQGDWEGDIGGSSGGSALYPPQVALVVSLTTPRAGARGKGRVFLPAPPVQMDASYRLDTDTVTQVATNFAGFLNSLETIIGGPAVVVSNFGTNSPVTGIRVGKVLDTHRSRRTNMPEEHQAITFANG